jgi:hypothetical protein
MRIIKGWKKISNQGGYVNEASGQTLVISKKEFSQNYHVLLFAGQETSKKEGKKISPEYATKTKAEACHRLDGKAPNGTAMFIWLRQTLRKISLSRRAVAMQVLHSVLSNRFYLGLLKLHLVKWQATVVACLHLILPFVLLKNQFSLVYQNKGFFKGK